jgi:hypothetical protein
VGAAAAPLGEGGPGVAAGFDINGLLCPVNAIVLGGVEEVLFGGEFECIRISSPVLGSIIGIREEGFLVIGNGWVGGPITTAGGTANCGA